MQKSSFDTNELEHVSQKAAGHAQGSGEVLAFIEPGSPFVQYLHGVARYLPPNIAIRFYSTRPKVRSKLSRLGYSCAPARRSVSAPNPLPPEVLQDVLNEKMLATNPDRLKLGRRIAKHYSWLTEFFAREGVTSVFVWNGAGVATSIALHLAHTRGLCTIFGENGYFPGTTQIDPVGVNHAASITSTIAQDYLCIPIDAEKRARLDTLLEAVRQGKRPDYRSPSSSVKPSLWARVVDAAETFSWGKIAPPRNAARIISAKAPDLPERFVFVPFQVKNDSQVLLYSPLVGNDMRRLLTECYQAVATAAPGYSIVAKLHPADKQDYSDLVRDFPDVIWLADYPMRKILAQASLVITINSTVGLEALMFHKPVITLGANFYNVDDIVRHVDSLSRLPSAIAAALAEPLDVERVDRLLYYLYFHFFALGSWKDHTEESYCAVAQKIAALLNAPRKSHVR